MERITYDPIHVRYSNKARTRTRTHFDLFGLEWMLAMPKIQHKLHEDADADTHLDCLPVWQNTKVCEAALHHQPRNLFKFHRGNCCAQLKLEMMMRWRKLVRRPQNNHANKKDRLIIYFIGGWKTCSRVQSCNHLDTYDMLRNTSKCRSIALYYS